MSKKVGGNKTSEKLQSSVDSDEGIFFMLGGKGHWFCNSCWREILKYKKWKLKK